MTGDGEDPGDAGYDEWLDAVDAGEPYYLECANGHGSLPPRGVCPDCGSTEFTEEPLPEAGTVETCTVTHVPTPSFSEDAPYVVAVADFGPVRLTGHVHGVDHGAVEPGLTVSVTLGERATNGEPLLVFEPR